MRSGNVHSGDNWREVLEPIVARYRWTGMHRDFRADAAFAKPGVYKYLEDQRALYAIRLASNEVLQREIAPLPRCPAGRPPKLPVIRYDDFWYRAGSWNLARRVVAKVEWHEGELFPRVGFIVPNMTAVPRRSGSFLQWTRYCRAVDQRGQVSAVLDTTVVPGVRGQPGASGSVRSGVQSWELPSRTVTVQGSLALVSAERAGQADQDGRSSGAARAAVDFSVVRGVGSWKSVPRRVGLCRPVIAGARVGERRPTIVPRGRALQGAALSSERLQSLDGGTDDDRAGQQGWFMAGLVSLISQAGG